MDKRMPSGSDARYRYFGWFTWRDLVRLGLPLGLALWCVALLDPTQGVSILAIFIGAFLGVVWYGVRPYGQPLEIHLYHKIRWLVTLEASP